MSWQCNRFYTIMNADNRLNNVKNAGQHESLVEFCIDSLGQGAIMDLGTSTRQYICGSRISIWVKY